MYINITLFDFVVVSLRQAFLLNMLFKRVKILSIKG